MSNRAQHSARGRQARLGLSPRVGRPLGPRRPRCGSGHRPDACSPPRARPSATVPADDRRRRPWPSIDLASEAAVAYTEEATTPTRRRGTGWCRGKRREPPARRRRLIVVGLVAVRMDAAGGSLPSSWAGRGSRPWRACRVTGRLRVHVRSQSDAPLPSSGKGGRPWSQVYLEQLDVRAVWDFEA